MFRVLSKFQFSFTYPSPRKLREVMKLSLIEREPKDKVINIWMDYHKDKQDNVAYCLSKNEYSALNKNLKESPLMLVPLKRNNGHFMLIGQNQQNSILFAYLEDYKKSPTFSQPYLIITMFDELLFQKEIVLMRGDIVDYRVNQDEAFYLMNQTLRFYLTPELYSDYVYTLNHQQDEFDYVKFSQQFQI